MKKKTLLALIAIGGLIAILVMNSALMNVHAYTHNSARVTSGTKTSPKGQQPQSKISLYGRLESLAFSAFSPTHTLYTHLPSDQSCSAQPSDLNCDGQFWYNQGCDDGNLIASVPTGDDTSINLVYSAKCQSNWAVEFDPDAQHFCNVYVQIMRSDGLSCDNSSPGCAIGVSTELDTQMVYAPNLTAQACGSINGGHQQCTGYYQQQENAATFLLFAYSHPHSQ